MIISTDNIKIKENIITYKCPVINDGTVLLLPSQVKKYLGSYLRHKIMNTGILINKNYVLDAVSEETIDNKKWALIIFNGKYYYTPSEYINTNNIQHNITEFEDSSLKVEKPTVSKKNIKSINSSSNNKIAGANDARREKYETEYPVFITDQPAVPAYNDTDGMLVMSIPKNRPFVIQSMWYNRDNGKNFWATQTFSESAVYIPVTTAGKYNAKGIKGDSKRYSNNKPVYWAMVCKTTECKKVNGEYYGTLNKGDETWPYGQDWDNHIHLNAYQTGNGIITYTYPANFSSPLADGADMIDKQWYGVLTAKKDVMYFEMHRKDNCKNRRSIGSYLDNITAASANSNSEFNKLLEYSKISVEKAQTLLGIGYVNTLQAKTGTTWIVTNYLTGQNGMKYYVCFRETSNINGPVAYQLVPDAGVEYLDYSPGIPDYTGEISADGTWIKDVKNYSDSINKKSTKADETNDSTSTKFSGDVDDSTFAITIPKEDSSFVVPGIDYSAPILPIDYDGWPILTDAEHYELADETPYDTRHITHMNRFHLPTANSGLSTKSFIFVTRPDLNLYAESNRSVDVDVWSMNPNLKRLPCFKYIARMIGEPGKPGLGNKIMNSLEYWAVDGNEATPWLSIMTNQAKGYTIADRELDITEMGETWHGNKVIYAEPTFKHKVAGTVTIPFMERRELSLYYTLRLWVEYIQAVSMGYCEPRWIHRYHNELEYASSLYFIQTDETMENIIYWEKLTGLIPLTVPDSFFEWSENPAKNMEYNITFAYSFRTVMDEYHLSEINNSYNNKIRWRDGNITGMPQTHNDTFYYNKDITNDSLITRVMTFFEDIADTEQDFNHALNSPDWLKRFYETDYPVSNASGSVTNVKFMPNWNTSMQMHGIPYVKGPFIEHQPSTGKYKLRWV